MSASVLKVAVLRFLCSFFQIYNPTPSDTARKWLTAFVPLPSHHQRSPENMGHYFYSGVRNFGLVIPDLTHSKVCQVS